ncbi:MFS transporter [Sporichthya polymorpha]|uniref:MFS transporter n=1 Tax=Sporichthya polymorpha TaxID=35751 RepID=UPI00039FDA62|nr:MFS transporter [Sporichthya polymorpha]
MSSSRTTRPRRRDYPGWRMVWALAVTETISYGALFYSFAVMLAPMREDFGAGTAQLSGALTLSLAITGLAAVPAGWWLDRHGARGLMTAGSLLAGVSVLAWSRATNLPQMYLAFVGMGLAGAAVLYEPAFAVINTWFERDRHTALLTLTVVAGFSSTVFLPLSQTLVAAFGWRDAVFTLGLLVGSCAIPHYVVLRRAPADLSLRVDGTSLEQARSLDAAAVAAAISRPSDARTAWRDAAVRLLTAAVFLETVAITVVAVHLVSYLRDDGFSAGAAATAAGMLGALQVAGRVMFSRFAQRFGMGRTAAAMVGGQALGVAALFAFPHPLNAAAFVLLFGAGFGVMSIARPALLGTYVARPIFASVSGLQTLVLNAGRVVAPVSAGALISSAGYGPTFAAVAACALLTAVLLVSADRAEARR